MCRRSSTSRSSTASSWSRTPRPPRACGSCSIEKGSSPVSRRVQSSRRLGGSAEELDEGTVVVVRARRRRLEVPLGRLLGRRRSRRGHGDAATGGSPRGDQAPRWSSTPPTRRRTRPAGCSSSRRPRRSATSRGATAPPRPTASSSTSTRRSGSSRTTATSSPCSTPTRPTRHEPSRTDLANIGLWQGRPYFILSRATGELAAWRFRDGSAEPLDLSS